MFVGHMRVSKSDGRQVFDLQRDALLTAGVILERIYKDLASGCKDDHPKWQYLHVHQQTKVHCLP